MDATREALKDAIELAEEGWGYVDTYFREKWEFAERVAALRSVLSQEPGGARCCERCGHTEHPGACLSPLGPEANRAMGVSNSVALRCVCGVEWPSPSPSPGEAPRELNSAERERISALLDAHERVVLLCEPPGCSQAEYDEAAGRLIHARDLMVAALRSAASPSAESAPNAPSPGEAPRPTCHACEIETVTDGSRPREEHDPSADCRYAASPSAESDLEALQKLCDEATPGPWEPCLGSGTHRCTGIKSESGVMVCDVQPDYFIEHVSQAPPIERRADHQPDVDFISAARTALPVLIAELRALRRAGGRT